MLLEGCYSKSCVTRSQNRPYLLTWWVVSRLEGLKTICARSLGAVQLVEPPWGVGAVGVGTELICHCHDAAVGEAWAVGGAGGEGFDGVIHGKPPCGGWLMHLPPCVAR